MDEELRARVDINELNARFALAVNTRDELLFRTLWLPSATWRIEKPIDVEVSGVEQIAASWTRILSSYDFFSQSAHAGTIEFVSGNEARQRTTCNEWGRPADGKSGYFNLGLYEDDLQREEGVWKYRKRVYRYLYLDTSPLSGSSYFAGNVTAHAHEHAVRTLQSAVTGASS